MCDMEYISKNQTNRKYDYFFETIYFVFWVITIMRTFLSRTTINFANIRQSLIWLSFIVGVFVCIKICYEWKSLWDTKAILFGLLGAGAIMICNLYLHHEMIGEYALLVLGVGKIDKNKLMKIFVCTTICLIRNVFKIRRMYIEVNMGH